MFEWEESTFLGLKSVYRRLWVTPKLRAQVARQAELKDRRSSMILLARMLSGQNVGIFETDNRALCAEDRVFLPSQFHAAVNLPANAALYELKTIVASLALRDKWQGSVEALPAYVKGLSLEFPHLSEKVAAAVAALPEGDSLWELFGVPAHRPESSETTSELAAPGELATGGLGMITEIEGKGQHDVEVLADPEDDGDGADLPIHTFEKAETLEETTGMNRKRDEDDELDEHEEALKEVNMTEVLRSKERPRSIYRSDVILDGLSLEIDEATPSLGIPYPEWNYRKRAYKQNWCFLQEHREQKSHPEWLLETKKKHAALVLKLKRQFANLTSEWLELKRQSSGDDFDIDAVVDSQVMLRSGHTPSERIYLNRKKDVHDVSVLLLLDLSYSTDAWVENVRVLDSIMETVYCVGEVVEDYIESFAVAGFSSNTRRSCRFEILKDFHEPWDKAKQHFGALQPEGYTRIGPALRHAQELIINEKAARKVIILVTDGRPCDYDRYEGEYGVKDVRKAIETGKLHGLTTHAFAIEKQACETFPRMFSRHHFDVVSKPDQLSQHMSKLFSRLITS